MKHHFLLGIDEAGRGPLAGPVAVGLVLARPSFPLRSYFRGLDDSKKLTPSHREELYEQLKIFQSNGALSFKVLFSSPQAIDKRGITTCIRTSIYKGVRSFALSVRDDGEERAPLRVLLDGLLQAPPEFEQRTVIGGDAKIAIISLASIAAKVERDRFMKRLSKKYPQYGFERHKGYGTRAHYEAIAKHGLCDLHRRSWNII